MVGSGQDLVDRDRLKLNLDTISIKIGRVTLEISRSADSSNRSRLELSDLIQKYVGVVDSLKERVSAAIATAEINVERHVEEPTSLIEDEDSSVDQEITEMSKASSQGQAAIPVVNPMAWYEAVMKS